MNFHVGKRRSVAAVLGALVVLGVGLVLALGVRSVVADPNSGPAGSPPNPGHSWSQIGDLPGTMWHSNNDGAGSGLDADTVDGLHASEIGGGGGHWTQAGSDLYPNNVNWNVGINAWGQAHKLTINSADESPDEYALRLIGPDAYGHGARLNFGDGNYVYIEEDEDDHLHIQGDDGIRIQGGSPGGSVHVLTQTPEGDVGISMGQDRWVDVVANRIRLRQHYGTNNPEINLRADGMAVDLQANNADLYIRSDPNDTLIQPYGGKVGMGTSTPDAKLHVVAGTAYGDDAVHGQASAEEGFGVMGIATGTYGVGVYAEGPASGEALRAYSSGGTAIWATTDADYASALEAESGGPNGWAAEFLGNVMISSRTTGDTVITLGEGLDYAEGFDVSDEAGIGPGTVLVIDAENPGELAISAEAYDPKVAGIVSGANGLDSAVQLGGDQFDFTVALAGRVYCNVDASYGEVSPGDLLTTSPTPGYAMVVEDYSNAQGAILGKAMEELEEGEQGQILVLVTLQ